MTGEERRAFFFSLSNLQTCNVSGFRGEAREAAAAEGAIEEGGNLLASAGTAVARPLRNPSREGTARGEEGGAVTLARL